MRVRRREPAAEDFQMAPMIDMVFLLLVFFMCASSMSQAQKRTPVELPVSLASRVPEEPGDRALVTVQADGAVYLGGVPTAAAELGRRLQRALRENPHLRLQVRADARTPFARLKEVLRTCAEAGAYEIIYATHQTD